MDASRFNGSSNPHNGFDLNDEAIRSPSHEYPCFKNGCYSFDLNLMACSTPEEDPVDSAMAPPVPRAPAVKISQDAAFTNSLISYMGQHMEEGMEEKGCMFHDPLALQAAEKSFYDALAGETPLFPDIHYSSSGNHDRSSCKNGDKSTISGFQVNYKHPSLQSSFLPLNLPFQAFSQTPFSYPNTNSCTSSFNGLVNSSSISALFGDNSSSHTREPKMQYNGNNVRLKEEVQMVVVKEEQGGEEYLVSAGRSSKTRLRDGICLEDGRRSKHFAVNMKGCALSEMFDDVLLCPNSSPGQHAAKAAPVRHNGAGNIMQQALQSQKFHAGYSNRRIQVKDKEAVDLRTLLLLCARAVSSDDRKTTDELLNQIRQHSSPFGDGCERFAYYFATGLVARLEGTGIQLYTSWASKETSAADMLKAYQAFLMNCPFTRFAIFFANHHILKLAEKAQTLHIIDYGIRYGFQWPILIERLSTRPGGPPKLRITGIDLPQPGLRPLGRVRQTGRRLAKYCERFNVPFEYNAIAQKWETIKLDDLKIRSGEKIVVNCLLRFKNLLDESVAADSPRTAVLNFIRKINPDIFVHSIENGSYNAPFFVTRFREASFHFSLLYDMFNTVLAHYSEERLVFEKEFIGREVINVIACEGSERVERPETYKKWQVRNTKAGFKQLPVDRKLLKTFKAMVKAGYHKEFVIDEDGKWMLQGWTGRIYAASSCWVPSLQSNIPFS